MDGVQSSRIENNLVYGNHASGISLYKIDGAAGSNGNFVVNNTVYVAADGRWALNIQNASTGNTVRNNILLNAHEWRGAIDVSADSLTGFTSDYNAVISRFTRNGGTNVLTLAQWQSQTGQDLNSLVATSATLFANAAGNDFHLSSTSPAKNRGTSVLAPPADREGLPRPAGAAIDIGAFEFGALAGDYTRDGKVDAGDYLLWRRTLGANVSWFYGADGSGNRIIDAADYDRWSVAYGALSANAAAVSGATIPEPTTATTLLIGVALMYLRAISGRFELSR
jgi:hypothetical protein